MYLVNTHQILIAELGEGVYADLLLKKWLADPDGFEGFINLADAIYHAPNVTSLNPRKTLRKVPMRTYKRPGVKKWRVVVWYLSMGYSIPRIANQLQLSPNTINQHMRYARRDLDLGRSTQSLVVSTAFRRGLIP